MHSTLTVLPTYLPSYLGARRAKFGWLNQLSLALNDSSCHAEQIWTLGPSQSAEIIEIMRTLFLFLYGQRGRSWIRNLSKIALYLPQIKLEIQWFIKSLTLHKLLPLLLGGWMCRGCCPIALLSTGSTVYGCRCLHYTLCVCVHL